MQKHLIPKLIGVFLILMSIKMTIDLINGQPAGGIVRLFSWWSEEQSDTLYWQLVASGLLVVIGISFGARALLFNRVCIGEQCPVTDDSH